MEMILKHGAENIPVIWGFRFGPSLHSMRTSKWNIFQRIDMPSPLITAGLSQSSRFQFTFSFHHIHHLSIHSVFYISL